MFTFGAKPNPKITVAKSEIRVEKAAPVKKPSPLPSKLASRSAQQSRDSIRPQKTKARARPAGPPTPATPDRLEPTPRKRKALRQRSPAQQVFSSGSDDEVDSPASNYNVSEKRHKSSTPVDLKRQLRAERLFSEKDSDILIHAADVANENDRAISVELQYPAAKERERYRTFVEKDKDDKYVLRPIDEFITISEVVVQTYLTAEQRIPFTEPEPRPGILRKLQRAGKLLEQDCLNEEKQQGFKDAVEVYNAAIKTLMEDGKLSQNIGNSHQVSYELVDCILDQVYERAVSPRVKTLTKMKSDDTKDNTYGELLHKFVSKIIQETALTSDQVFVDLGSGVGNVVLQAALEAGCESWGCEMMGPACDLAEAQKEEFAVRCRLWGIKPGRVRLERGDFRENIGIRGAMRRADVILVNNEVFGSDLNQNLVDMFLDLKDGCKIVSLKPFVPPGYKRTKRNSENPVNLLRNEEKQYYRNFVSWKDDGGSYFIATKDSKRYGHFD